MTRDDADLSRAAVTKLLDAVGEAKAREILVDVARPGALAEFERVVVLRLAMRLLAEREPRPLVRERLRARGLSWAHAYRVINAALDVGAPGSGCLIEGMELRHGADTVPGITTPDPGEHDLCP